MKVTRAIVLMMLGVLAFAGCVSQGDPSSTIDHKWMGGIMGANVTFIVHKLDDGTYAITATSGAMHSEKQTLEAWTWMADKIAAGRRYTKEIESGHLRYGECYYGSVPGPGWWAKGVIRLSAKP